MVWRDRVLVRLRLVGLVEEEDSEGAWVGRGAVEGCSSTRREHQRWTSSRSTAGEGEERTALSVPLVPVTTIELGAVGVSSETDTVAWAPSWAYVMTAVVEASTPVRGSKRTEAWQRQATSVAQQWRH